MNLSQPLISVFKIKEEKYKVEYKGLHLLCISCGRFDNYREGCPKKNLQRDAATTVESLQQKQNNMIEGDSQWMVVHNVRKVKKPMNNNGMHMKNVTPF